MDGLVANSGPPPNAIRHYFEQEERLAALKDAIKRTLSADHIVTERVAVDQTGRFAKSYLEGFAARIQAKLKSAIDRHVGWRRLRCRICA